jgi:hypothetical protein
MYLNQDTIDEALISLAVIRSLPSRFVEWPEFRSLCRALNPQSLKFLPTHSQLEKKIDASFTYHKDIVRRLVQSAISRIHLSVNIWTSPDRHLLLAICGHGVDHLEKHFKALLALCEVPNHTGAELFTHVLSVLEDYGIARKLGAIVCDNATTNDTLCHMVEDHLLEEDIEWNSTDWRIRCLGHIINLAVQAFLFQSIIGI